MSSLRFVDDTEHRNDVPVLRLGDKLGEDTNVIQSTLSIGDTHRSVEVVDGTKPSRVVPTVLTTRNSVQIEVNTDTVFPSPLNSLQEVPEKSDRLRNRIKNEKN